MKKKIASTYDELMQSLSKPQRKKFEEGYRDLLLSEFHLTLMQEDYAHAKILLRGIKKSSQTIFKLS